MSSFLIFGVQAQQQEDLWIYPPVAPDAHTKELLKHVGIFVELANYRDARTLLHRIATEQAGNSIGATALLDETFVCNLMGKLEDASALNAQVIQQYPGSRFEFAAKMDPLRSQLWSVPTDQAVAGWGAFAESFGGPPVSRLLAGSDLEGAAAQVLALHPETRLSLSSTYSTIAGLLQLRPEQCLNVARFGRLAFDSHPEFEGSFSYKEVGALMSLTGKTDIGSQPSTPNLTVLSPAVGATVGLQPTISVRVTTGNYHYARTDLARLSFLVDGVEKQIGVKVASQLDRTLPENGEFETLTLSLTPTLTPGSHTVTVKVKAMSTPQDPASGSAQTIKTWSFTVANTPEPPTTSSQTLQASKDALVYEKNPHSNEGANPKLTLEKITGKASRNLLGFNLSGINTATVSKATLVLTIDPSDQATGWGNGDMVNVKPVTVAWQEGNGKSYGLPSSQQTAGSGAGTTWFSPTDDNISNNSSNSVTQWSGGAIYATTGAAPPLTVQNHQTGELRFNVTADVRAGALQGWLLRKDAENKGSKVTFYSKEGAAAAGNPALAPRLILEFGGTTTRASAKSWLAIVRDLMEQGYRQLQAYRTPPALSWLGRALN